MYMVSACIWLTYSLPLGQMATPAYEDCWEMCPGGKGQWLRQQLLVFPTSCKPLVMEDLLCTFHCPRTEDAAVINTSIVLLSTVRVQGEEKKRC